jgi:hypothetical protein
MFLLYIAHRGYAVDLGNPSMDNKTERSIYNHSNLGADTNVEYALYAVIGIRTVKT